MITGQKILAALIALLIAVVVIGCSSPEEKKARFYNKGKELYEKDDYAKARVELRNALQIDPKYADAYYLLGLVSLKSGDARAAYGAFKKTVELVPQHWDAHVRIGRFLLSAGQSDETLEKAELILKADPKHEEGLILKSAALLQKKDVDSAKKLLESVIGKEVRKADGYFFLATAYSQKGDRQAAEKILKEGIAVNPKATALYLSLADLAMKEKKPEDAIDLLRKVIEIEPDLLQHRIALANLLVSLGREQEGLDGMKAYVAADPQKEDRWIQVAQYFSTRTKPEVVEQQLLEGIRQNAKSFKIRFALSEFYLATKRPDQALAVLQQCLGLERDQAHQNILKTKNTLARVYFDRQDITRAKQYADEVIKESPKDAEANFLVGTIHLRRQETVQAIAAFRTVVSSNPKFIPGHISLAEAHMLNKEPNLATDTLQNALKQEPDSRELQRALARNAAQQKDFKTAEARFRDMLKKQPDDVEVRADLGDLLLLTGDLKRAETEYNDIKRKLPNHPIGYTKLSALYGAQKKWDRAIAELENLVRVQPELWSALNDLAYLLAEHSSGKKDLDRALALAEKARMLNPENAAVLDTTGWIHYLRGEFDKAVTLLVAAQSKDSGNVIINYHLGMAQFKAGNVAKAKEHLKLALASKAAFPGKAEAEKVMAGIN